MVVLSKRYFYEKLGDEVKCKQMHLWNDSCPRANLLFCYDLFLGSMKFYMPIYMVKAIINHKRLKQKLFWTKLLQEQLRSSVYGMLLGNLFLSANCFLCKVSGRLHYYNIGLISGLVSGLALLAETKENQMLDTLIFFNLLAEAVFRNLNYFDIFTLTNTRETIMFMAMSSVLMHLLQNRPEASKLVNFWFYRPHILKQNGTQSGCGHKGPCDQYALKGVQKYFVLGYAFSVVKAFIPRMLILFRKPSALFSILIRTDHLRFGTFIAAYVGIYKYVTCHLLKDDILDPKYYGAIAGLLAGATYSISPNLQVLTVGITTILQILYNAARKKLHIKNYWPQQLIYMLSHSLLMHNAIMCRDTCPAYYINTLNICSGNAFSNIYLSTILKYTS